MTHSRSGKWSDALPQSLASGPKTPGHLDLMARTLFRSHEADPEALPDYVMSSEEDVYDMTLQGDAAAPRRLRGRYAAIESDFDRPYLRPHPLSDHFDSVAAALGPNEARLLSAFVALRCRPMFLVGGIGVGKTTVCRMLSTTWLPTLRARGGIKGPFVDFTFDFNQFEDNTPLHQIVNTFSAFVFVSLDTMLESSPAAQSPGGRLAALLFGHVCDDLLGTGVTLGALAPLAAALRLNPASSRLYGTTQASGQATLVGHRQELWERLLDRSTPETANALRLTLAALAVRTAVARDIPPYSLSRQFGLHGLAVLDNIDKLGAATRRSVLQAMRTFALQSDLPTILPARQTTFAVDTDGSYSVHEARIVYRGPIPRRVVLRRLSMGKGAIASVLRRIRASEGDGSERGNQQDIENMEKALEHVAASLEASALGDFFSSLCGSSVRKGLVLARRLLANRHYDPTTGPIHERSARRALLHGTNHFYQWLPDDEIDNIFGGAPTSATRSPLIKLRILLALRPLYPSDPRIVSSLLQVLTLFGYSMSSLVAAVNELKARHKRLIWSDKTRDDFTLHRGKLLKHDSGGGLHLTSIGAGYVDHLRNNVDYIQEMMLDTYGPRTTPRQSFADSVSGRLEMLVAFLEDLVAVDLKEIGKVVSTANEGHTVVRLEDYYTIIESPLVGPLEAVIDFLTNVQPAPEVAAGLTTTCRGLLEKLTFAYRLAMEGQ